MQKFKFLPIFLTLLTALVTSNAQSVDIVRLQFDYADPASYDEINHPNPARLINSHYLDLELHTDSAPLTVANYLDYVINNKYDGTFIYRSLPGFVLQTGGYTFRPSDPINNQLRTIAEATGLEKVPLSPSSPVVNEFSLSNIRGTIAMAKLDNQPDSATNEWFINLADNSANLDSQNGGFTVFGSVIDDGMVIADEITTFPIHQFISNLLGSAFANMPVTSAIFGAIYQQDMIMISSASKINRPIARISPSNGDYDLNVAGDAIDEILTITIRNTGNEAAVIGTINPADLVAPFSIASDNCSGSILVPQAVTPTSICTIDFLFSPTTLGTFNDNVLIPYTSQNTSSTYSVTYPLQGRGVPSTPVINSSTTSLNFLDSIVNTNSDSSLTIRNEGGGILNITNIGISGTDATDFSILSGCGIGTSLAIEAGCTVSLRFLPTTTGIKNAVLNIESNAGPLNVILNGTGILPIISIQSSINVVAQLNKTANNFAYLTNAGTGNLALSTLTISGTDAAYFSQLNNCPDTNNAGGSDAPLGASQQCIILIEYTPITPGPHSAVLTITSNDPATPTTNVTLTGSVDNPSISVSSNLFIGTAQIAGEPAKGVLVITNTGLAPLEISTISGLPINGFTETNNCTGTGLQIPSGFTCTITITYTAAASGTASAILSVISNDPISPIVNITVDAYGDNDIDGIISSIENSGPNSGDGNNDQIADETQNNVASFNTSKPGYLTLVSDNSLISNTPTILRNIVVETSPNITVSGHAVAFDYDLHGFEDSLPDGDRVNIAIYLAADARPTGYYKFGPTPDDATPHWYDFKFDATTQTGANFIGKVTIDPYGPNPLDRYMVVLSYIDGERGDDDLIINGKISQSKGGLDFNTVAASSSSGTLSMLILLIISLVMPLFRARSYAAFSKRL